MLQIDFGSMKEWEVSSPGSKFDLLRRDLQQGMYSYICVQFVHLLFSFFIRVVKHPNFVGLLLMTITVVLP